MPDFVGVLIMGKTAVGKLSALNTLSMDIASKRLKSMAPVTRNVRVTDSYGTHRG
jgi:predicted GTPase